MENKLPRNDFIQLRFKTPEIISESTSPQFRPLQYKLKYERKVSKT